MVNNATVFENCKTIGLNVTILIRFLWELTVIQYKITGQNPVNISIEMQILAQNSKIRISLLLSRKKRYSLLWENLLISACVCTQG